MATNTYTALKTTVLSSSAATVTLSSIDQGYTDLVVVASVYSTANDVGVTVQYGNSGTIDTGNNYSTTLLKTTDSGSYPAGSARQSNASSIAALGWDVGLGSTNGIYSPLIMNVQNYANTSTYKTTLIRSYGERNVTSPPQWEIFANVGLWRSTNAIDTIRFNLTSGSFASGSTFTVYGIASTPALTGTSKATGGTITYDSFGYVYHTFTSSGTFTPSVSLTCDYLVVAGGGGGNGSGAGALRGAAGGGAGGLRSTVGYTGGGAALETALALSATGYTVTIGAGGSGGSGSYGGGSKGNNSVFGSITSIGGGGGFPYVTDVYADGNGGSGGGGARGGSTFGTGTSGQGYNGGVGDYLNGGGTYVGGGGGGAGGAGGNYSNGIYGGVGVSLSTFAGATGTGAGGFYAGGGGSGAGQYVNGDQPGLGGAGGGATGSAGNANGNSGSGNTGGGGGGAASANGSSYSGGNGGSGIVIVRYYGV